MEKRPEITTDEARRVAAPDTLLGAIIHTLANRLDAIENKEWPDTKEPA